MSTRITTVESRDTSNRRLCVTVFCGPCTADNDRKMYQMEVEGKYIICYEDDIDKLIDALCIARGILHGIEPGGNFAEALIDVDNTMFNGGVDCWADRFHARGAAWNIMLKAAERRTGRRSDRTRADA